MDCSKHLSCNFIKTIVLIALMISLSGISGCNSKLTTSKKLNTDKEIPVIKELTIHVAGAELYCKIVGKGRPILFIHGGPGLVHNYFLPYMESLLPYGYQLIFYDQRGNGKSPAYDLDSIKLDVFVQDIESIREKLGIDKLVLFSHSSGGYLAYLYALKYPQHIDAIIFCDNGPLTDKGIQEYSANWKRQLEQIDIKTIKAMPGMTEAAKGMPDELVKITANRFYDKTKVADFIINSRTDLMSDEKGQEIRNRLYREMDETLFNQQEYKKPKVYSLLIHGAEDPIPLWTTKQWANILDARLEVISKSNHFPFVEKTNEVARLVDEFLRAKKGDN
jgi:proline iminopeptidase